MEDALSKEALMDEVLGLRKEKVVIQNMCH